MKRYCVLLLLFSYYTHLYAQKVTCKLQDKKLDEISGLGCSKKNPNILWMHNDSGDGSYVFGINDSTGKLVATLNYSREVRDCEDMAMDYKDNSIYIGDIGDNNAKRKYIAIYKMSEPALSYKEKKQQIAVNASALYLKYPDGPRDAETLMIDPVEKLLYIVSKREDSVSVYTAPLNYKSNDTITLKRMCRLHFNGFGFSKWITAGDISADGTQILLKNYTNVYYWKRKNHEPVWQTMQRKPVELPYTMEKQGEAICFTPNGMGYFTTSEGKAQPVYYYEAPKQSAQ